MVLAPGEATSPLVVAQSSTGAPAHSSSWIEGVGHLSQRRAPPDIPPHRWRQFVSDCTKLLTSSGWAERAAAFGWDTVALFGCCRHRPLDVPAAPVCCGSSMAGGWSSFIETGPLLSWRRMDRNAF